MAISDEKIVAALMDAPTIREVARICGCGERTIYTRLRDVDFRQLYEEAQDEILRNAVHGLQGHVSDAINALAQITSDPEAPPGARISAAREILSHYERFSDRLRADTKKTRRSGMTTLEKLFDDFDDD